MIKAKAVLVTKAAALEPYLSTTELKRASPQVEPREKYSVE
ncbi:hypothetical protein [Kibdelosporangium philippinense]